MTDLSFTLCACLMSLLVTLGLAVTAVAAPVDSRLDRFVAECGSRYSDEHQMVGQKFSSPGYHTTVATGTWVHPVLPSLDYALGLLHAIPPPTWIGRKKSSFRPTTSVCGLS